jgi:REP element-mobilizing transposase RayT
MAPDEQLHPGHKSIRLPYRDYSAAGIYYVTICAANNRCVFGRIENAQTVLTSLGKIARDCWLQIPSHYANTKLHSFVIMPNHLHGLIEIAPIGGPRRRYIVANLNRAAFRRAPCQPLCDHSKRLLRSAHTASFGLRATSGTGIILSASYVTPRNLRTRRGTLPRIPRDGNGRRETREEPRLRDLAKLGRSCAAPVHGITPCN